MIFVWSLAFIMLCLKGIRRYKYIYIYIVLPHALCVCDEAFFYFLFLVSKFYFIGKDYSLGEKKERDIF